MKVCCLASGSKGNLTYVETEDLKILIDCGLGIKKLEKKLAEIGVNPQEITTILITHEHTDHIAGLAKFCEKYNPQVHICPSSYLNMASRHKGKFFTIDVGMYNFRYGDTIINPIELSHDSARCFGYSIICSSGKVSIVTDTGTIPYESLKALKSSDIVIIESNHNEVLLMNNPNYPMILKKRILSKNGHLSNRQCAQYIADLCEMDCRHFVLAHLSEENNTPKLAYMDISEVLLSKGLIEGRDYFLDIALQDNIGTFYSINADENEINEFLKN